MVYRDPNSPCCSWFFLLAAAALASQPIASFYFHLPLSVVWLKDHFLHLHIIEEFIAF